MYSMSYILCRIAMTNVAVSYCSMECVAVNCGRDRFDAFLTVQYIY